MIYSNMGGSKRTPFVLRPFVEIQSSAAKPLEGPELLEKLKEIDKTIEETKKKREEFKAIASELRDMNHPETQEALKSVEEADQILANLIRLRHDTLDGR